MSDVSERLVKMNRYDVACTACGLFFAHGDNAVFEDDRPIRHVNCEEPSGPQPRVRTQKPVMFRGRDLSNAVRAVKLPPPSDPSTTDAEAKPKASVVVTVELPVDPDWVSVCFESSGCEVFGRDYCGYWMHGRAHDPVRGWLCWEKDDLHNPHAVTYGGDGERVLVPLPGEAEARAAWEAGLPMPEGSRWHRLDLEACARAFAFGVAAEGADWFERGDANSYDLVLQLALLGEVRYG